MQIRHSAQNRPALGLDAPLRVTCPVPRRGFFSRRARVTRRTVRADAPFSHGPLAFPVAAGGLQSVGMAASRINDMRAIGVRSLAGVNLSKNVT